MALRISCVFLIVCAPCVTSLHPIVNTTHGRVRGFQETVFEKTVNVFLGIPYAAPPVGDLRFKRTVELSPWGDRIYDALQMKSSCFQPPSSFFISPLRLNNATRSEDCLYLNIWAPHKPRHSLPTLLWIHGGAFRAGSSTTALYNGKYVTSKYDVIVVGINYRVGALGFLYTGSDDAPGNQGLLDQSAALKWVFQNIEQFGGDANTITIFGESAGSASVNHHLFSPLSRNSFTSAIMQSGTSLAHWSIDDNSDAKKTGRKLAELLGCKIVKDEDVLSCLRNSNPYEIVKHQRKSASNLVPFAPIVDGYFLPDHPREMLKKGNVKNTSIIIGVNKNEGTLFLSAEVPQYFKFTSQNISVNRSAFIDVVDAVMVYIGGGNVIKEVLISEYENSFIPSLRPPYLTLSDDVYGDILFKCPTSEFASKYAALGNPVFVYSFEHNVSSLTYPAWMGVRHGDELELLFGHALDSGLDFSEEDRTISQDMMTFWTNLAKTGNPNGITVNPRWPLYDANEERYIVLDATMATKQGLRHRQCVVWEHTIPLIHSMKCTTTEDKYNITNDGKVKQYATHIVCIALILGRLLTN